MAIDSHVTAEVAAEQTEAATAAAPAETMPAAEATEPARDGAAPIWLQRLSLLVLVLFCVYLGVLVMVLPWWARVWDQNMYILSHPALAAVLHAGAMRGLVSGLGLLDIWIGVSEAVHYRDHRG
ncbi:MAG: hypothetical protein ABR910_13345 [Acidobacteriaceae bacterium]|jgi:hypothetical protein